MIICLKYKTNAYRKLQIITKLQIKIVWCLCSAPTVDWNFAFVWGDNNNEMKRTKWKEAKREGRLWLCPCIAAEKRL